MRKDSDEVWQPRCRAVGGRVTRWRGRWVSLAPVVLALATVLLAVGGGAEAQAGTCTAGATFGVVNCAGASAGPGADATQNVAINGAATPTAASVNIADGFGLDVGAGNALDIVTDNTITDLSIGFQGAALIKAPNYGVNVDFRGTGALAIRQQDATRAVTLTGNEGGTLYDALNVVTTGSATTATIDLSNSQLVGGQEGAHITHNGTGALSVTLDAVTGQTGDAIDVEMFGTGDATLTVNGNIDGGKSGIEMTQGGAGALRITTNGTVIGRGTAAPKAGIYAEITTASGTSIDVTANGDIQAAREGVELVNHGIGVTSFTLNNGSSITGIGGAGNRTTNDAISITTGTSAGSDPALSGVYAVNVVTSTGGRLEAGTEAIEVNHAGVKGVYIRSEAVVDAGRTGIFAGLTNANAGLLTVESNAAITAAHSGIDLSSAGTGDISVTTTADITANGAGTGNVGVGATHSGTTGNVSVTIGSSTGAGTVTLNGTGTAESAVYAARTAGTSGNVSVATNAAVTSTAHGVIVRNLVSGTGTAAIVQNKAVSAGYSGLYIDQRGTGDATITARATVTANGNATGNVGVGIDHAGTGNISITTDQLVDFNGTGNAEFAIDATHAGSGDITILARGEVQSESHGITADHSGTANLVKVEAQQKITAKGIGIDVLGGASVKDVQVIAAAIDNTAAAASVNAIHVDHRGSGAASITANGRIDAKADAVFLTTTSTTTTASITTKDAMSGGENGIDATHNGSGVLTVTVGGNVTGGTGYAIRTATQAGNTTRIDISTGTVQAASGNAISNNQGDSVITTAAGTTIVGAINLGSGSDQLTINGADVSGVTDFDGGDDIATGDGWVDKLTFSGVTLTTNGGRFRNWEQFDLAGNSTLKVTGGTVGAGQMNVSAGSTLDFSGADATLAGHLRNDGAVTSRNGATGDILTISGNYDGNGTITIDTKLDDGAVDTTDKIIVRGDNNGTITIDVHNTNGTGAYTGNGATDGIRVVEVQGASNGTIRLANGPLVVGAFVYDVTPTGYLQSRPAGGGMGSAVASMLLPAAMESLWQRMSGTLAAATTASVGTTRVAGFTITPTAATPVDLLDGLWVRARYRYQKAEADVSIAGASFSATGRQHRIWLQLGYTHTLAYTAQGRLAGSVFAQYKNTRLHVDPSTGAGSSNGADAFGGGASLTWLGASGLYGDLYAEVNRHRMKITDDAIGGSARTWATTWHVSVETGYRVPVATGINLIPQAQVNVGGTRIASFSIGATSYDTISDTQVTGRVGMGVEFLDIVASDEMTLNAQFTASLLHRFDRTGTVTVSGQNVVARMARTLAEARSALSASMAGSGLSLFLENSVQHSLSGPRQFALTSSLGLKLSF